MSKLIQLVSIAALNLKAGTQFRAALNEEAVADYTQLLKEWKKANTTDKEGKPLEKIPAMSEWSKCPLPPITAFETADDGTIVADGFQRTKAAKAAGLEEYAAEVKKGTKQDAIIFALGANDDHGARLTTADKQKKFAAALKIPELSKLSNNSLAKAIGVSEFFVRTNRPAGETPQERVAVTKSGKKKTMNTAGIGKKGGKKAAKKKGKKGKDAGDQGGGTGEGQGSGTGGEGMSADEQALANAMGGSGEGSPSGKGMDAETEAALTKIKVAVANLTDPEKFEAAIRNGSISHVSTKDLRELAQTSPERIAKVYQLVFGEKRMKPKAAFAFIDKETTPDTKLSHLMNLTVVQRGAVIEKVAGFHVLVIPEKDFTMLRNLQYGSAFIAPNASLEKAKEALASS